MIELRKKEFAYRGKSLEELKALDVREFAKLLQSRKRRNVLRNFQKIEDFVSQCKKKVDKKKLIKTHKRAMPIVPKMIGMRIAVHNGKGFENIDIVGEMLGHSLGEFVLTRTKTKHNSAGAGGSKGSKSKAKI